MKTDSRILLTMLIWVACGVRHAEGLVILTPGEHVSTRHDHLVFVGRTAARSVQAYLNGELVRTLQPVDSIFHLRLTLPAGLNEVICVAVGDTCRHSLGSAHAAADTVEVICSPSVTQQRERLFPVYDFHGSDVRLECLDCHATRNDGTFVGQDARWCFTCHSDMSARFRTHIRDDARACVGCHRMGADLEMASSGGLEDSNPCYLCHKDKIGEFSQEFIHGPVAGGSCIVCHEPHGSVFASSLVTPVPVLCPSCHDIGSERQRSVQHEPFQAGRCETCHDPHSTNNRWVLVRNSQEICAGCHDEAGLSHDHPHPYNVKPRRRLAADLRLTDKGNLECLSCHNPHASDTTHLLRTSAANACAGCHPEHN